MVACVVSRQVDIQTWSDNTTEGFWLAYEFDGKSPCSRVYRRLRELDEREDVLPGAVGQLIHEAATTICVWVRASTSTKPSMTPAQQCSGIVDVMTIAGIACERDGLPTPATAATLTIKEHTNHQLSHTMDQ